MQNQLASPAGADLGLVRCDRDGVENATITSAEGRPMNKVKLNLDALKVETFDTTPGERARGTVMGQQDPCTCPTNCTCPGCPTCNGTCDEFTCGNDHTCLNSPCQTYPNQTCGCTDGKYVACGEA
jgi:hypothetical protein